MEDIIFTNRQYKLNVVLILSLLWKIIIIIMKTRTYTFVFRLTGFIILFYFSKRSTYFFWKIYSLESMFHKRIKPIYRRCFWLKRWKVNFFFLEFLSEKSVRVFVEPIIHSHFSKLTSFNWIWAYCSRPNDNNWVRPESWFSQLSNRTIHSLCDRWFVLQLRYLIYYYTWFYHRFKLKQKVVWYFIH